MKRSMEWSDFKIEGDSSRLSRREALSYTVRMSSGEVVHLKNGKHSSGHCPELRARIDGLLGPGSHRIISAKPDLKSGQSRGKKFPSKQN